MASSLITVEDAARHLGVSHRTVRKYIADGLLSTRGGEGSSRRKWLDPLEVEELRADRCSARGSSLKDCRRELVEVRAALRRLRADVDLVLRIVDAHEDPLRLNEKTGGDLYEAAACELSKSSWTLIELSQWAEIFLRVNEEDLREIRKKSPWSPFLRLCIDMIAYVLSHPAYKTTLDLQSMHRRLTEARRRLRVAALCYSDLYEGAQGGELRDASFGDPPSSIRESLLVRALKRSRADPA